MRAVDEEVSGVSVPEPDNETGHVGLYIHIPFCHTKCPYCSFNSVVFPTASRYDDYLSALLSQVKFLSCHPWIDSKKFTSLFVGGGTPTTLLGKDLAHLIRTCIDTFPFISAKNLPEVSVEMNPNTSDIDALKILHDSGVNRLSIGVQSFDDDLLGRIGRSHTSEQAERAFVMSRSVGFDNISIDLMYGLPCQRISQWQATLEKALTLKPQHMSVYCLTVEEGTHFYEMQQRGELDLPSEEAIVEMAELTEKMMENNGYGRYEISNYAQPCFECIHNINYWENGSYVALGAGAVSCFSGIRARNIDDLDEYVKAVCADRFPFAEVECLGVESRFRESIIMGLRMAKGVSLCEFEERFGLSVQAYYGAVLEKYIRQGFVELKDDRLTLTRDGLPVANQILAELV